MDKVSVIIPVKNGAQFIADALKGIASQTAVHDDGIKLEVVVFDDASTDDTLEVVERCRSQLEIMGIALIVGKNSCGVSYGCGVSRNRAMDLSSGNYFCFNDADDVSLPSRISSQLYFARVLSNSIVGSKICRHPEGSTPRYTSWLNGLTNIELYSSRYRECTLAMPTWFCAKRIFEATGGFPERPPENLFQSLGMAQHSEAESVRDTSGTQSSSTAVAEGKPMPEDLLFLYKHLDRGGGLHKVDQILVVYRYHPQCLSLRVPWRLIWDIRVQAIQENVLRHWKSFGIWNAGKEGKRFYRSLSSEIRHQVTAFYDVNTAKIDRDKFYFDTLDRRRVPLLLWTEVQPPFVTCVKAGLTEGAFERNLSSLGLKEGIDYFCFS